MKNRIRRIRSRLKKMCAAAAAVILFSVMLLSAALLAGKYRSDQRGKEEYQFTRKIAGLAESKSGAASEADFFLPLPDESRLSQINPDYSGWIFIPGTSVNYPVVYPKDNSEYLNKTFEGEKNSCGCLFFEASCPPFSSENTVIYGHNMKSGEMFGSLKKYREKEFFRKNKTIYLCFGGAWTEYQVQKAYLTASRDKAPYESGSEDSGQTYLTLSTCHGKEQRLIIQAEIEKTGNTEKKVIEQAKTKIFLTLC